jgi:phosphoglycolate phosphatase-like HAD superfamily hydrolase
VLETHGLTRYFDMVVSSLDVEHPKPHPESLIRILEVLEIGRESALYVGDSSVDEETAKAAGVPFVAYRNETLPADYHASRMWDVAALVH